MSEHGQADELKLCQTVNAELLTGIGFSIYDYIFTNTPQTEFRLLLDQARAGKIDAWRVVDFITDNRTDFSKMLTHWGIGHIIDQDTHTLGDIIMGVDRKTKELKRIIAVNQTREDLLNGAGIQTSNVLRRSANGILEPVFSPISIGNKGDLVENYLQSLDQLFSYYRQFFSPDDIIKYCQITADRIQTLLDNGGVRGRKLDTEDIERETRRLNGLKAALAEQTKLL